MTAPPMDPMFQQHRAARVLGLHVSTLIRARKAGELEAVKIGRSVYYQASELARWVSNHTVGGDE